MSDQWTEKDVIEHCRQLKSPFENLNNKGSQNKVARVFQQLKKKAQGQVRK
jgi:hypothetical protein